jgi:hypothetical protein
MVKIVPMGIPKGPEIVTLESLTRPATGISPGVGGTVSPLQAATETVNALDKYISLADRGVSLLGRVDSILQRAQDLRPHGSPAGPGPVQHLERLPPGATRINSDPPVIIPVPEAPIAAPVPVIQPGPVNPPQGISLDQVIMVLGVIEGMQPGITVAELRASIERQPEAVQRLIEAYTGAVK